MKYIFITFSTLILILHSINLYGQDINSLPEKSLQEVVVTATKFKVPKDKLGQVVYLLSEKDIQQNAGKTIVDLLNEVPGIQTNGNFSTLGQNIGIYMRGGRNKDTLILIDGVPINDPTQSATNFDLRLLSLSQVESIEVLKGGQSTLYGTGAAVGVINIKLKKNVKKKPIIDLDLNYGSYNTTHTSAGVRHKINKFSYSYFTDYHNSEGLSAASDEKSTTPFGKDKFTKNSNLIRLGYEFTDNFKIETSTGYTNIVSDYDGGAFVDADNTYKSDLLKINLMPTYTYANGKIILNTTFAINERKFESKFPGEYRGENLQLNLGKIHNFTTNFKGVWGVNFQSLSYKHSSGDKINSLYSETEFSSTAPYLSFFYDKNKFNIHIGGRLNNHSTYGTAFVYNVNFNYLLHSSNSLKIKEFGSVSTSYITPTGYQLFSAQYGNKELTAEKSINFEIGTKITLGNQFTSNISYYHREESSPINFVSKFENGVFSGQYKNGESFRVLDGYELDIKYQLNKKIDLKIQGSYITTEDKTTLYNIPNWKGGLTTSYTPFENTNVVIKYNFTGIRTINTFALENPVIDLPNYHLVDLYVQQRFLSKKLMVYGAINNIFDIQFVGVYGYTTKRINYNVGLSYQF